MDHDRPSRWWIVRRMLFMVLLLIVLVALVLGWRRLEVRERTRHRAQVWNLENRLSKIEIGMIHIRELVNLGLADCPGPLRVELGTDGRCYIVSTPASRRTLTVTRIVPEGTDD